LKIAVQISVGELLDKISILQIKSQFTDNPYVIKEKEYLIQIVKENIEGNPKAVLEQKPQVKSVQYS
jgi:hypothetical protein